MLASGQIDTSQADIAECLVCAIAVAVPYGNPDASIRATLLRLIRVIETNELFAIRGRLDELDRNDPLAVAIVHLLEAVRDWLCDTNSASELVAQVATLVGAAPTIQWLDASIMSLDARSDAWRIEAMEALKALIACFDHRFTLAQAVEQLNSGLSLRQQS